MKKRRDSGLLSLEASISLTIFIFLMLFMYSFFVVFEAQNAIAHVLLNTADSMSKDIYSNKKLLDCGGFSEEISKLIAQNEAESSSGFVSHELWNQVLKDETNNLWDGSVFASDSYAQEKGKTLTDGSVQYYVSGQLEGAIQEKFLAYLSNGNREKADRLLKERYHIQDGFSGLDFSHSYVSSGTLHLSVIYTLSYEFNVFDLGQLKMEQKCGSKLWQ